MNLQPCKLCIWQRWGHLAVIIFGFWAMWSINRKIFFCIAALTALIIEVIIAAYHSGIELKLWNGPKNCTNLIDAFNSTPQELLEKILNAPVVKCDEIPWTFLNLSMASWNLIISIILLVLWAYTIKIVKEYR